MIVISNSSPLIALSRVDHLDVLKSLFGEVLIPDAVYQETVVDSNNKQQRENISKAIYAGFIKVIRPTTNLTFIRNLGRGEKGVLNLAKEMNPDILIIDDKKARREAEELGFESFFTTDILNEAKDRNIIESYDSVIKKLFDLQIYLPE
jgi:predicted nucleic acid-binding protein